ncbi:MAG: helix-turn-helix transcriptional regulator [Micromonosporaceae bacterium]|nr:helix-turn-helix transcriptional regulator [Micromonosporaceae bacterium]
MVAKARDAHPNVTLYNLRDAAGESQQDVADALNALAAARGIAACVTANQVSRWERGTVRPQPLYRRLLAEHFGVSVEELGLTRQRISGQPSPVVSGSTLPLVSMETPDQEPAVERSRREWLATRTALNRNRVSLAITASKLYPVEVRVGTTGLIAPSGWTCPEPVPLNSVRIVMVHGQPEPTVLGTEPDSALTRPFATPERRYPRYSTAVRDVARPRLLENRLGYRLVSVEPTSTSVKLTFGTTTYFGAVDVAEALAHEFAAAQLGDDGHRPVTTWRGARFRRAIGNPFDLGRRAVLPSIDTLTIRNSTDGPSFVLHQRSTEDVAVAAGMLHVMPAGVFQPSSIEPDAQVADFDLWRNMMREFSEEFLGNPEHDGDGAPARYDQEPLASLDRAYRAGHIRVYLLGVALDALTLWGELLTVAVIDAPVYDALFGSMVNQNDEGTVVRTGQARPTPQLPFTEQVVMDLLDGGRLAPAAAGCLEGAWRHRRKILGAR